MSEDERSEAALRGGRAWVKHHLRCPTPLQLVCVAVVACAGATHVSAQGPACHNISVGPSQLLADDRGRAVTMDWPSAVQVREGVAIFARKTAMWESERIFFDTTGLVERVRNGSYILPDSLVGYLLPENGTAVPIRRPEFMMQVENIVGAPDNHGGAWVAWIAADSLEKRTLWIASYSAGRWSAATSIFAPRSLNVESLAIAADETGKPYVSVGSTDGERSSYVAGAAVLSQRDGQWAAKWITTSTLSPFGTQITSAHGVTRVVMGGSNVTGTGSQRADTSGIFSAESTDGGENWSKWKLIASSDSRASNWPQLVRSSADTLHVLWVEIQQYNSAEYLVRSARSGDNGHTWIVSDPHRTSPLKSAAAFVLRDEQYYIAEDSENQLALVELRNNEALVVNTLPWHETSMPPRAVTMGDHTRQTLVIFAEAVPGAYPNLPQYQGRRVRYAWITPCRQEPAP